MIKREPPVIGQAFYYGAAGPGGHQVFITGMSVITTTADRPRDRATARWLADHDGDLPPDDAYEREGVAMLRMWPASRCCALAFWDRSGDSRPGSHSDFLLPGLLTFEQAVTGAARAFPEVFDRIPFEVVRWHRSRRSTVWRTRPRQAQP